MKKIPLIGIVLFAVLVCAVLAPYACDYLQRWYGTGGNTDRIQVFLYQGEQIIPAENYSLTVVNPDDKTETTNRQKQGYSIRGGEYGIYSFQLTWQEKTASFGLWNTNNWWRTTIILRILDDGTGLEQVNNVFNNNPSFIETSTVLWE